MNNIIWLVGPVVVVLAILSSLAFGRAAISADNLKD